MHHLPNEFKVSLPRYSRVQFWNHNFDYFINSLLYPFLFNYLDVQHIFWMLLSAVNAHLMNRFVVLCALTGDITLIAKHAHISAAQKVPLS
uniref:Uncharacterized protein n=1 Tax=Anguilla anguilla TaxID=7936 RepID=A0A0E9WAU2_ANGAN